MGVVNLVYLIGMHPQQPHPVHTHSQWRSNKSTNSAIPQHDGTGEQTSPGTSLTNGLGLGLEWYGRGQGPPQR